MRVGVGLPGPFYASARVGGKGSGSGCVTLLAAGALVAGAVYVVKLPWHLMHWGSLVVYLAPVWAVVMLNERGKKKRRARERQAALAAKQKREPSPSGSES